MTNSNPFDWSSISDDWAYAYGLPSATGQIKVKPEGFRVIENMDVEPEGKGEHVWLHITKVKQNSEQISKALARYANVTYRDVSYSGLKDFFAITDQWFSVWMPGLDDLDWSKFAMQGVTINQTARHSRKIRRGTHRSNGFTIVIQDFDGDFRQFEDKLQRIRECGVPNYFGEQRFGRDNNNMQQALELFTGKKKIKNRSLRSLLYSSARSWLFNCIVSKRLELGTWDALYLSEPANLNNTNSVFNADDDVQLEQRLRSLDIHPTAPLFGKRKGQVSETSLSELEQLESEIGMIYQDLCDGLLRAGLSYQRRPIRMAVNELSCIKHQNSVELSFELQRGQYATSVLRELIIA